MTLLEFDYDETIRGFMVLRDELAKKLKEILSKYESLWSKMSYSHANEAFPVKISIKDFRFATLTNEEFNTLHRIFHGHLIHGSSELTLIDDILTDITDNWATSKEDTEWIQEEWVDIYKATYYTSEDSCLDKDSVKDAELFY